MEFLIVLFLAYALIFGAFCAYLAGEKGRSGGSWFFLGLIFGILALLVLIGLPSEDRSSNKPRRSSTSTTITPSAGSGRRREEIDVRQCPHCIQEVHELATACPHCQSDLPEVERCSYGDCRKIINPTDDRCEDDEGNPYCNDLHRRRPMGDRGRRMRVQCDECGKMVFKSDASSHLLNHMRRK